MEQLKNMKQSLTNIVQSQISGNLHDVDAKELGEAVDMIKDLAEAIYYCTVTEAMEESEKGKEKSGKEDNYYQPMYYTPMYYPYGGETMYYTEPSRFRNASYEDGRMAPRYREEAPSAQSMSYGSYQPMGRDSREGRSPMHRKMYMESKEMHQDKTTSMKELEKYLQELSTDMTELVQQATPEEKTMLQQKIAALATKIK